MLYRCPDAEYPISPAVHLGRLARFYPGCRRCPHAADTGTLPARQVKRLQEVAQRPPMLPRFHDEGASGVYGNELAPADAHRMAAAFGVCLRRAPDAPAWPAVVLAGDGRPLSANLVAAVGEGLRWAACDLIDIGPATTACLLMAIAQLDAAGGVLVGNPGGLPHQAGLKFFAPGPAPVSRGPWLDAIEQLSRVGVDRPARRCGSLRRAEAEAAYLATLSPYYHALRPLRFVLDARCPPVVQCLRKLTAQVAVTILPSPGTGPFTGDCPDFRGADSAALRTGVAAAKMGLSPSAAPGQERIGQQILAQQAHFGLSIADDGETCRLWDEQGRAVPSESVLLLVARHLLGQQTAAEDGAAVVVEEGASAALAESIASCGGAPVHAAAARSAMAAAMRDHRALIGGGPSGRYWYPAGPFAVPDALKTLSLLLVLLSRDDRPLSQVLD